MKPPTLLRIVLCHCLATGVVLAKGPKDGTPSKAYQRKGGFSAAGSSNKSKYIKASPHQTPSRMPSQTPIKSKYQTARGSATGSRPSMSKYERYAKKRPTSAPQTARPGYPPNSGRNPPIVFHQRPSKGKPGSGRPTASQPSRRPAYSGRPTQLPTASPSKGKYYRPALRPSQNIVVNPTWNRGPIIVNRPTTINQSTTNVTHNTTNINQWYTNNHWHNRTTINSAHWNERPWWYSPDYNSWHHGHWHDHYIDGGRRRNDWRHVDASNHNWLSGLAAWGLGNLIYRSGYQAYSNPYYVQPVVIGTTTIDYTRPISVQQSAYERAYARDEKRAAQLRDTAQQYFSVAREAFFAEDLDAAYGNIEKAIALMPDDVAMHEFRALVLFAAGKYREAAEVIHAVLAVAPGWDWTTLSGLYRDTDTYSLQLERLEQHVRSTPRSAYAHFLLAYHYITLGHSDQARRQLREVLQLDRNDRLAKDLLDLFEGPSQGEQWMAGDIPTLQQLQGDWKARRTDGEIELEVDGDRFTWDYDLDSNDQKFNGKCVLADDLLVFATPHASQLAGHVRINDNDRFAFL